MLQYRIFFKFLFYCIKTCLRWPWLQRTNVFAFISELYNASQLKPETPNFNEVLGIVKWLSDDFSCISVEFYWISNLSKIMISIYCCYISACTSNMSSIWCHTYTYNWVYVIRSYFLFVQVWLKTEKSPLLKTTAQSFIWRHNEVIFENEKTEMAQKSKTFLILVYQYCQLKVLKHWKIYI